MRVTFAAPSSGTVPAKVAALGQSLGAATVIGLTRKDCCRDSRVPERDGGVCRAVQDEGRWTNRNTAKLLYNLFRPPRFLVGLEGAQHSDAIESQVEPAIPARAAAQRATIAFLDAVFHGDTAQLDAVLVSLASEGNIVQSEH